MNDDQNLEEGAATLVALGIDVAIGLPVATAALEIAKRAPDIHARFLRRKAEAFGQEWNLGSADQRAALLGDLADDRETAEAVVELILVELDRVESEEKARLLSRAVRWKLSTGSSLDALRQVVAAIERCFVSDLEHLKSGDKPYEYPADVGARLSGCGMIVIDTIPAIKGPGAVTSWSITQFGQDFYYAVVKPPSE